MAQKRTLRIASAAAAVALLAGCSADTLTPTTTTLPGKANVFAAGPGQALTAPSTLAPAQVVTKFLAGLGLAADVASLRVTREGFRAKTRLTHLRFEQEADGLRVVDAYAKAAVNERGQLVHLIERLARLPQKHIPHATLDEADALAAVLLQLGYATANDTLPARLARARNTTSFDAGKFFFAAPTVERVVYVDAAGRARPGFVVETWTREGNQLHRTVVDEAGRVVRQQRRTAKDSYNVFLEDPWKSMGAQTVVNGPAPNTTVESPAGWLGTGTQSTFAINGNNVSAYLDTDKNNRADRGGTTVSSGNFLTAVNLTTEPSTTGNKAVSVQNLFYLNNVVHDLTYASGFDEAAGNFQVDNFGRGGAGGDPVNAEAQDGSALDNANFATPGDGSRPRMQMFLWSGAGPDARTAVSAPAPAVGNYDGKAAGFGPAPTTTGVTAGIVLVSDGVAAEGGGTVNDGCEGAQAALKGKIALVDRGFCNFTVKVLNAQSAGAKAVIVVNNVAGDVFAMGGSAPNIKIPSMMISQADGATLKANLGGLTGKVSKHPTPPLKIDASLDADIVFHEFGHGLTWRMIGDMDGPLAGAVGEGASDALAMIINGDDVVAEYSISSAAGIRRAPYASYPRTYGDVTGAEVHDDGEPYAAIIWRFLEKTLAAGGTAKDALDLFIGGMNFTPMRPAYEDMRDGMLAAAGTNAAARCRIWTAFAEYGVGVGATGVESGAASVTVTESFALPAECQ